jgi:hypothetical protein
LTEGETHKDTGAGASTHDPMNHLGGEEVTRWSTESHAQECVKRYRGVGKAGGSGVVGRGYLGIAYVLGWAGLVCVTRTIVLSAYGATHGNAHRDGKQPPHR